MLLLGGGEGEDRDKDENMDGDGGRVRSSKYKGAERAAAKRQKHPYS